MRASLRVIAIVGAILVACSLFLDWYSVQEFGFSLRVSGWKAFHSADIALVVMAGAALALVVRDSLAETKKGVLAVAGLLGLAAFVLALVKVLSPTVPADSIEVGAYCALVGSAALALAGFAELINVPGTLPTAKQCPDCRMAVPTGASVCRHCGYRFAPAAREERLSRLEPTAAPPPAPAPTSSARPGR